MIPAWSDKGGCPARKLTEPFEAAQASYYASVVESNLNRVQIMLEKRHGNSR
jgi:hypothetical protein